MSMLYIAAAAALTFAPPPAAAEAPEAFVAVAPQQQGKGGGKAQGGGGGANRGGQQEARGGGREQERQRETRGRGQEREPGRPAQSRGRSERPADDARGGGSERRQSEAAAPRGSSVERRGNEARGSGGRGAGAAEPRGAGASDAAASRVAPGTRGRSSAGEARGPGRLSSERVRERIGALPPDVRRFAGSSRASERMAVGALARGTARGLTPDAVLVRTGNDRVRLFNRRNELLLDLDERRARDLGFWELRRLGDRQPRAGAPAFCRSGEGHPVWGREWCLDKGFGLGSRPGLLWSRGLIDDVSYRPAYYRHERLDRGGLIGALGDIVFGRLALHALTLGFDRPLTGVWVAEPESPRILRVYSGDGQVAEFVDLDRDDRVEVLYVAQPVW